MDPAFARILPDNPGTIRRASTTGEDAAILQTPAFGPARPLSLPPEAAAYLPGVPPVLPNIICAPLAMAPPHQLAWRRLMPTK